MSLVLETHAGYHSPPPATLDRLTAATPASVEHAQRRRRAPS